MKQSSALQPLLYMYAVFAAVRVATAQSVFINQVPLYASLTSCAEAALSTVVRDMYSGCGDGGSTTSYSCFCSASSNYFAGVISTAVDKACSATDTSAASTAGVVFDSYCHLGVPASTTVGEVVSSASAGASLSVVTSVAISTSVVTSTQPISIPATPTESDTTSSSSSSTNTTAYPSESSSLTSQTTSGLSPTARTAIIAVCIIVGVLGLVGVAVFFLIRRRKQARHATAEDFQPQSQSDMDVKQMTEKVVEVDSNNVYEADAGQSRKVGSRVAELPS